MERYATDTPITGVSTTYVKKFFILFACPVEDVAAQNLSAATLPATVDVPKTSVMSVSHLCCGFKYTKLQTSNVYIIQ